MGIANDILAEYAKRFGLEPADFVRKMDRTSAFWSDRLTGRRNIGAKLAREIDHEQPRRRAAVALQSADHIGLG